MSQEDNAEENMAFLFPDAPPAAQPVAPPPAPASPPTMAERCTGLLFCHVCGAAAAAEQAGEFCPRCRSRRCVSCGDL